MEKAREVGGVISVTECRVFFSSVSKSVSCCFRSSHQLTLRGDGTLCCRLDAAADMRADFMPVQASDS